MDFPTQLNFLKLMFFHSRNWRENIIKAYKIIKYTLHGYK